MARTGPQKIPGARFNLFFGGGRYAGSDMEVNCGVIHTTEGATLYDYEDGRSAPTVTAVPDFGAQRLVWHQHFDVDQSARALVNAPGGVQTNTANVFQIELVGTCDPATHAKWARAGVQHIYWPEPPDWAVRDLAWLMLWLNEQHGIPLTGAAEWLPYPESYGASRVRMSFDQWTRFTGWCGHMHVPENDHGDPGALPFARILAAAKGEPITTQPPTEEDDLSALSQERSDSWNGMIWGLKNTVEEMQRQLAALQGAVTAMTGLLVSQHADLTAEQIEAAVEAGVAAGLKSGLADGTVSVDINVHGTPTT